MQYLFELSGEDLDLAEAECEAANPQAGGWKRKGRLLACTGDAIDPERLAFTKRAYEVVTRGPPAQAEAWLKEHPRPIKAKARFFRRVLDGDELCSEEAYRVLHAWLGQPPIDLDRPEEQYGVLIEGEEWLVVRQLWRNEEDFESRKSHNKPAPHPTGMHPKLARAMVNLAHPKRGILDPFCGAGGILLEAGLMGLEAKGIDIDPAMLERAQRNLDHFGVRAELVQGDALDCNERSEAIVTDAPYGRNSKAEELNHLFSSFLAHAATITDTLIIGLPDITDNDALIKESPWQVRQKFTWRLHASLKKEIYVLTE